MDPAPTDLMDDLLERMQAFRDRSLIRVQGHPDMALNAFLVSSLSGPRATAASSPSLHGFFAQAAQRAFKGLFKVRAPDRQPPSPLKVRLAEAAPSPPPTKSAAERKQVEDVDRALFAHAVQQGWLSQAPIHAELDGSIGRSGEPIAVPALGKTFIASNLQGDYENFMPSEGASGSTRSCMRWFILFHEASHLEFETIRAPFNPTPGRISKQTTSALNDWVFEVVHHGRRQHRELFNECFADVYGAMMLLSATNFSNEAVAVLQQVHDQRVHDRQQIDQERVQQGPQGRMSDHHCTDFALRHMVENLSSLRSMNADEMRSAALRYASDGFLDFIEPTRLTPSGEPVGALLHHDFVHPALDSPAHLYYMASFSPLAMGEFLGHSANPWLTNRLQGHPGQSLMRKLWDEAGPDILQALSKEPGPFKSDLEKLQPWAQRRLDEHVYPLVRAHLEGVPFQASLDRVHKIFESDNRTMVKGLSQDTFAVDAKVDLSQWRSDRSGAAAAAVRKLAAPHH